MSKTYCIFSAHYLPNVGGIEKYTQGLAKAFAHAGDRVIIVTNNIFDLPERETLEKGVEIVRLPCHKFMNGRYPIPKKNEQYRQLFTWLSGQTIDYMVVNARFYPHTLQGIKLAEIKNVKPLVIDHGSAHLSVGSKLADWGIATIEHGITALVKRHDVDFYAVSDAGIAWLTHFKIKGLGVLNNAIDAQAFIASSSGRDFRKECGIEQDDFLVVFIGRFIPEKGIHELLSAAKLLEENSRIQFIFAGVGPLEDYVKAHKPNNVHLVGRIDASDVAALFLSADVNCLPSYSEGFPTALLESAACATPSIITRVGGVSELIPTEDYGVVLERIDEQLIVDEILRLAGDKVRSKQVGMNIQSRVLSCYSWENTADAVRKACKNANEC